MNILTDSVRILGKGEREGIAAFKAQRILNLWQKAQYLQHKSTQHWLLWGEASMGILVSTPVREC